jgi:hypothetical protein
MLLYLDTRLHRSDGWSSRLRILLVYLLCLPLAAAAKENGLLLPGFLGALELTVLAGKGDAGLRRFSQFLLLALSGSALALGGMYWLRHLDDGLAAAYTRRGFTLAQRLLTEARVLCLYLAEILAPSRARLGFLHDDIAVSQSLWVPATTLPACLTVGALGLAGWGLRRRQPLAALGLQIAQHGHDLGLDGVVKTRAVRGRVIEAAFAADGVIAIIREARVRGDLRGRAENARADHHRHRDHHQIGHADVPARRITFLLVRRGP